MPTVYFMVGVPASGKSTFLAQNAEVRDLPVVSSDKYIEAVANREGKTYDQVFSSAIHDAGHNVNLEIDFHLGQKNSFVLDQTNLTEKSRAKRLSRIPKGWNKVAIYLPMPEEDEWKRRLASRPGKTIPFKILEDMKKQLQVPSLLEGFDRIIVKDN